MYCIYCGKPNPDTGKFCQYCGKSLEPPTVPPTPLPPIVAPSPAPVVDPYAPRATPYEPSTTAIGDSPEPGTVDFSGFDVPAMPRLTLVRDNGERLEVSTFPATVGKGSAANVRISGNNAISRAHVRISQVGTALVVEDLSSTNHTFLNGEELEGGELVNLTDGDTLSLGNESLRIELR